MMRIGLEVHVQLPTRSKLFCSCPARADEEPNSAVCPVCLGMPGSKPSANAAALEFAVTACRTLNCRLLDRTWFSRKTYFYPDLAKNFQITQFEAPIGVDGYLDITGRRVRIQRIHLEEDPARAIHELVPGQEGALLDYNRSGVPLIEIVTAPDMESPAEAREFLRKMLGELKYVGVIAEDEDQKIRADGNISVTNGERVEIKNITGLRNLERALDFEFHRQEKVSGAGIDVRRETRSFDEERGVTVASREKEEEQEYGYIFEPDLPVYDLAKLAAAVPSPQSASQKTDELASKLQLPEQEVSALLMDSMALGELLESIGSRTDPKKTLFWLSTAIRAEHHRAPEVSMKGIADELEKVIAADADGRISDTVAKSAIKRIFGAGESGELPEMERDEGRLTAAISKVLMENEKVLDEIGRQPKAINNLVGKVIRETKGRYDERLIVEALKREIEKRRRGG